MEELPTITCLPIVWYIAGRELLDIFKTIDKLFVVYGLFLCYNVIYGKKDKHIKAGEEEMSQRVKLWIETGFNKCAFEEIVELPDYYDEEDLEKTAQEYLFENILYGYEVLGKDVE